MHPITHDVYVAGSTSYDPLISDGMRTGAFPWIEPTSFGGQVDTFVVRMTYDLHQCT